MRLVMRFMGFMSAVSSTGLSITIPHRKAILGGINRISFGLFQNSRYSAPLLKNALSADQIDVLLCWIFPLFETAEGKVWFSRNRNGHRDFGRVGMFNLLEILIYKTV